MRRSNCFGCRVRACGLRRWRSRPISELERLLLAPHCAQTHAALCKRGRHAVHARDRVKQRPNRVIAVFRNRAGSPNVLHKEDSFRLEAAANASKDVVRARLVMNRVKGRNKVVSGLRRFAMESCEIARLETQIAQLRTIRVIACIGDGLFAEVVSRKAAVWKLFRQEMKRASASAADVEDADAILQGGMRPGTSGRM